MSLQPIPNLRAWSYNQTSALGIPGAKLPKGVILVLVICQRGPIHNQGIR